MIKLHNFLRVITRRKVYKDEEKGDYVRSFYLIDILTFGIASVMGPGLYITLGPNLQIVPGVSLLISIILAGFCICLNALCFIDLSYTMPSAGSVCTYVYCILGEFPASLINWILLLQYGISASVSASACSHYTLDLLRLIGVHLSTPALTLSIFGNTISCDVLAFLHIIIISYFLTLGNEENQILMRVVTFFNLQLVLMCFFGGLYYFKTSNVTSIPITPLSSILNGAGIFVFCFVGFESVTVLSQEAVHPRRDIPIGIVLSLFLIVVLYLMVGFSLIGMVTKESTADTNSLAAAFSARGNVYLSGIILFGTYVTSLVSTWACLQGQHRIFHCMALDGIWFSQFKEITQDCIPVKGIWITGIMTGLIAMLCPFTSLVNVISFGSLICYTVVCSLVTIKRNSDFYLDWKATSSIFSRSECLEIPEARTYRLKINPHFIYRFHKGLLFMYILLSILTTYSWERFSTVTSIIISSFCTLFFLALLSAHILISFLQATLIQSAKCNYINTADLPYIIDVWNSPFKATCNKYDSQLSISNAEHTQTSCDINLFEQPISDTKNLTCDDWNTFINTDTTHTPHESDSSHSSLLTKNSTSGFSDVSNNWSNYNSLFFSIISLLGILVNSYIITSFTLLAVIDFFLYMVIGSSIYFCYGYWNSTLNLQTNEVGVKHANDSN